MITHQSSPNIKLEMSKKVPAMTSFGGIGLIRESLHQLGLVKEMRRFCVKRAGYGDDVIVEALILLIASGGRSLSDWEYLKGGIRYYITADQTAVLKMQLQSKQNWKPLILDTINTGQDVVSIFHAPSATSNSEQRFRIRTRKYIAIRKKRSDRFI